MMATNLEGFRRELDKLMERQLSMATNHDGPRSVGGSNVYEYQETTSGESVLVLMSYLLVFRRNLVGLDENRILD